jgi:hypothetical protein
MIPDDAEWAHHPGRNCRPPDGWSTTPIDLRIWVPDPEVVASVPEVVACPTCLALVTEPCRTTTGRQRKDHDTRLVPRRCKCGGELPPRRRYCAPCALESRRATWRKYARNRRDDSKEAA